MPEVALRRSQRHAAAGPPLVHPTPRAPAPTTAGCRHLSAAAAPRTTCRDHSTCTAPSDSQLESNPPIPISTTQSLLRLAAPAQPRRQAISLVKKETVGASKGSPLYLHSWGVPNPKEVPRVRNNFCDGRDSFGRLACAPRATPQLPQAEGARTQSRARGKADAGRYRCNVGLHLGGAAMQGSVTVHVRAAQAGALRPLPAVKQPRRRGWRWGGGGGEWGPSSGGTNGRKIPVLESAARRRRGRRAALKRFRAPTLEGARGGSETVA
ncbi:MAG: hypothetical protein J3K34DRAFT_62432 [Monoraphidium minutum]|nr:MAG: hypothetical protein J3K34DRAFT_62432 [Monoraphidium minutum]